MLKLKRKSTVGKSKFHKKNIPFYEIYSDGIYICNNNGVMIARKKMLSYEDGNFPLVEKGQEGFELVIEKLPFKLWEMIWNFYYEVNKQHGAEATVLIYKDYGKYKNIPKDLKEEYGKGLYKEGSIVLYVPKQRNSSTLTEYSNDEMRKWLGENLSIILDTHSHNSMESFFSSTDDRNEQSFQFYGVYGRIGTENTFKIRYRYMEEFYDINIEDLFKDVNKRTGVLRNVSYPKEWHKQCTWR